MAKSLFDHFFNKFAKVNEGGMGGLNRCAPASDVSYKKVLEPTVDTWGGQQTEVNEMDVDTLKQYTDKVQSMDPATTPKYKMVKHIEGHRKAKKRIARKTGDRSKMYEDVLYNYLNNEIE